MTAIPRPGYYGDHAGASSRRAVGRGGAECAKLDEPGGVAHGESKGKKGEGLHKGRVDDVSKTYCRKGGGTVWRPIRGMPKSYPGGAPPIYPGRDLGGAETSPPGQIESAWGGLARTGGGAGAEMRGAGTLAVALPGGANRKTPAFEVPTRVDRVVKKMCIVFAGSESQTRIAPKPSSARGGVSIAFIRDITAWALALFIVGWFSRARARAMHLRTGTSK